MRPHIIWDALKAVARRKIIAKTTLIKKIRRESYSNQSVALRELELQYQMTGDPKIYEQIKDTKRKITELLLDENGKKNLHLKQNY